MEQLLTWFRDFKARSSKNDGLGTDDEAIMKLVENNVIGNDLVYESPFGKRSGMSLYYRGFHDFVSEGIKNPNFPASLLH